MERKKYMNLRMCWVLGRSAFAFCCGSNYFSFFLFLVLFGGVARPPVCQRLSLHSEIEPFCERLHMCLPDCLSFSICVYVDGWVRVRVCVHFSSFAITTFQFRYRFEKSMQHSISIHKHAHTHDANMTTLTGRECERKRWETERVRNFPVAFARLPLTLTISFHFISFHFVYTIHFIWLHYTVQTNAHSQFGFVVVFAEFFFSFLHLIECDITLL